MRPHFLDPRPELTRARVAVATLDVRAPHVELRCNMFWSHANALAAAHVTPPVIIYPLAPRNRPPCPVLQPDLLRGFPRSAHR
eukprot:4559128-Pyramimonas_sp.AAC.1